MNNKCELVQIQMQKMIAIQLASYSSSSVSISYIGIHS